MSVLLTSYSQSWTFKTTFPGNQRNGLVSTMTDTKGYAGLGASGCCLSKDLWEFDPLANTWTKKADFPGGLRYYAIAFSINNKVYIGLGKDNNGNTYSDLWEYNPLANSWTKKADFPGGAREKSAAFVLNNIGYVSGGIVYTPGAGPQRDLWAYDPATNTWQQKASIPTLDAVGDPNGVNVSRTDHFAVSICGKGYVGGGRYYTFPARNDMWEYNPTTNTWTLKGILPSPNGGGNGLFSATAIVQGDRVYIGAGKKQVGNNFIDSNMVWEYNPTTNVYAAISNLPTSAERPMGFSFNGRLYMGNGNVYEYAKFTSTISGSDFLCSTSSTYTLSNPPPSAISVSWTATPSNLFATTSGSGTSAITQAASGTSGGKGLITFLAQMSCGDPIRITKAVSVGNYPPLGTSSFNSNCSGNTFNILNTSLSAACTANTPIHFVYNISDLNYTNLVFTAVSVPSGSSWGVSGRNLYMTVNTPSSTGSRSATIRLNATGPCGPYERG